MVAAPWLPTCFKRFAKCVAGSSTRPARIVTDAGPAYLKAINNPIGPHALVRELVGTRLARWFGLDTLDMAIIPLEEGDEIPIDGVGMAQLGPSLVTRTVEDRKEWGGTAKEFDLLDNPEHISWLVVFDTWTRNADRHPPAGVNRKPNRDNVFFSPEGAKPGRFRLLAMDHSECFGGNRRELNASVADIDNIRDDGIYGLFPEFTSSVKLQHLQEAAAKLREIDRGTVGNFLEELPTEWEVSVAAKRALGRLVLERAAHLADDNRVVQAVCAACGLLPLR